MKDADLQLNLLHVSAAMCTLRTGILTVTQLQRNPQIPLSCNRNQRRNFLHSSTRARSPLCKRVSTCFAPSVQPVSSKQAKEAKKREEEESGKQLLHH
jgi:hypothetical protein